MFNNLVWIQQGDKFIKATRVGTKYQNTTGQTIDGACFERSEQIVSDMADLNVLNDPQLLNNLTVRYSQDNISTYVGPTLLVINPFKPMPNTQQLYIDTIIRNQQHFKQLEPHTFAVAAQAYREMQHRNQAIVISGESGAGKTENAKQCMNILTSISGEKNQLSDSIMGCNPILESFGNAKTARNNNSSRFGKYSRLIVENGNINGAQIINYLLEKSRVISQGDKDDNFHIFYYVLKGSTQDELESYYLTSNKYNYLTKGLKDINMADYNELMEAFNTVGLNYKDIFRVVAAVLLIGNLEFDDSSYGNNTSCNVKNIQVFQSICTLLAVDPEQIQVALTAKVRIMGKERIVSPMKLEECYIVRDSWAKEIYEQLFCWIVQQLNKTIMTVQADRYIGLLDIYGFEVFDDFNGFEQLMINYTNERLHQLYIEYVFKEERKYFVAENLSEYTDRIIFADNTSLLELFDKPPTCIFNLVDQACKLNQTDTALLQSLRKELKFPQNNFKPVFIIKHTAKDVEYTCKEFVEKNKDELPLMLMEIKSKNNIIVLQQKGKSICSKIKKEINDLMVELGSCGVHFIRCIKPNDDKVANYLDEVYALRQIRYLGVLDSLKVRKLSYPNRSIYKQFYLMYGSITNNQPYPILLSNGSNFRELVIKMFTEQFNTIDKEIYLFGKTQLFMQQECTQQLDALYLQKIKLKNTMATKIQRAIRCHLFRKRVLKLMQRICKIKFILIRYHTRIVVRRRIRSAITIQKMYQQYLINKKLKKFKKQLNYIKSLIVTYSAKQQYNKHIHYITLVQRRFRRIQFIKLINKRIQIKSVLNIIINKSWLGIQNDAAIRVQSYYRGYWVRKHYSKQVEQIQDVGRKIRIHKKVRTIQKWARGHIVRVRIEKMNAAAFYIQGYFKMRLLSDIFQRMRMAVIYIQRKFRELMPVKRLRREQYIQFIQPMEEQLQFQKNKEEQDLFGYVPTEQPDYDSVLSLGQESQVKSKIYLFSFVLDLEVLQDVSDSYQPSFADNYKQLFLGCFSRESPIEVISVGESSALAVSTNRTYCWGMNDTFQFGLGYCDGDVHQPMPLQLPNKLKQAQCGYNFTIILQDDNKAYLWGNIDNKPIPHPVQIMENVQQVKAYKQQFYMISNGCAYIQMQKVRMSVRIHSLSCGGGFTVLLSESGVMFSMGSNEHGQLGLDDTSNRVQPQKIQLNDRIIQVECGLKHCICLSSLKKVYTWGWGECGQLGMGDLLDQYKPQLIQLLADQIMAGQKSSLILKSTIHWTGSNGTIMYQSTFQPLIYKCQFLTRREYTPIRILSTYSNSISILYCTFACHKGVFDTNPSKATKICNILTQKWVEHNPWTIDPPTIESVSNYLSEKHQRKLQGSPQKQLHVTSITGVKLKLQQLKQTPSDKWSREDIRFLSSLQIK